MLTLPSIIFFTGLWGDSNDAAKVYNDDSERFLTALKAAGLTNYSYGCPRVGNEEFRTVSFCVMKVWV